MARATASLVLGAFTFAACEEVSVRDKSKDASPQKDAGPDAARSTTTSSPPDDPTRSACIALGASTCKASTDCCPVDQAGSAVECGTTGVCRICKELGGAACDTDGQCCAATDPSANVECRSNKKCTKCQPFGSACGASTDCCSGLSCKAGKCGACLARNETGCGSNADCCAGSVCATDPDNPNITRCVAECASQWSISNVDAVCKNAESGFQVRPCCAPLKCNFDIPASEAFGCGL
jgi:hypothetical protein